MAPAPSAGKPQRLMLATDLTPACDRAFDRAVQLAAEWKAELVLCHVLEASSPRPWGIEQRVRNAETEMGRLVKSAELAKPPSHHIVIGDPAERTLQHAREIGCDFLVTGPAHGKVLGDKLLGSTAARIVRQAEQPVLAVRRRDSGAYCRVAVAVDFSQSSRQAFLRALELFAGSELTLVHAYGVSPDFHGRNADRPLDEVEAEARTRAVRAAEQDMADLIGSASGVGKVMEQGSPEDVMTAYVEKRWPDLVVAGTHGKTGRRGSLMGSVAEGFLRSVPCDVLIVPGA